MTRWILPLIAYLSMVLGLHVFQNAWMAFGLYHGLILVTMLSTKDRIFWKELTAGWNWQIGGGSIGFGLGGGLVLFLLAPYAGVDSTLIGPVLARLGLHGFSWALFVVYHSLVNPWFEEVFWRGRLGDSSYRVVVNDVVFAGYHALVLVLFLDWVWIALALVILTAAGWLWRQIRRRNNGLLLPVISHMSADASIMMVVFWLNKKIGA